LVAQSAYKVFPLVKYKNKKDTFEAYFLNMQFILIYNCLVDLNRSAQYLKQIEMNLNLTPQSYTLYNNYPNPFNPATVIKYSLPEDSWVIVKVYNVIGQLINTLINSDQSTGDHRVVFDGSNQSSGVYFAVLKAQSLDGKQAYTAVKKMLLK
jgi:hypothetical protein